MPDLMHFIVIRTYQVKEKKRIKQATKTIILGKALIEKNTCFFALKVVLLACLNFLRDYLLDY